LNENTSRVGHHRRELLLLLLLQSNTFWAADGKINFVFFDSFFPKKVFCVLMSFLSRRYKIPSGEREDSTGTGKKKEEEEEEEEGGGLKI
jgi:hypothetical protein